MKKIHPFTTYIIAAAGTLSALLRAWLLSAGTDRKGLYPAAHIGWIGYVVLSLAVLAGAFFLSRTFESESGWQRNFPRPHIFRSAGYAIAASGVLLYGLTLSTGADLIQTALYWGSFLCGAALLMLAAQIFCGKTPSALAYPVICLYFALLLFTFGKDFGAEPEMLRFLPQLFAVAASALAAYQLWGFSVQMGNRQKSLFWSWCAAYFCLAAAPGNHMVFIALGLWHLLSHPVLSLPPVEEAGSTLEETTESET